MYLFACQREANLSVSVKLNLYNQLHIFPQQYVQVHTFIFSSRQLHKCRKKIRGVLFVVKKEINSQFDQLLGF